MNNNNKNDALTAYLSSISSFPVLSDKETRELAKLAQAGDKDAEERLVNCNLKLSAKISKDYVRPGFSWLEAISWANEGLMSAVMKWDPEGDSKFSSYAARVIATKLRDGTRSERLQPISDYAWKILTKVKKARSEFINCFEYEPSDDEIADYIGGKITADKVREVLDWSRDPDSYDAPVGDDDESATVGDFFGEEDDYGEF